MKKLFVKYAPEIALSCDTFFLIALMLSIYQWAINGVLPNIIVLVSLSLLLIFNTFGLICDSIFKIIDKKWKK